MTGLVVTFLAIGGFALLLLVLSLFGGHLHLGHVHLHLGHHVQVGHGTELTLPSIAGFLGAFGFAGAVGGSVAGGHGAGAGAVAVGVGLVAAIPTAFLTGKLVDAAMNMATDGTLESGDLVGTTGVVITPVPVDGYGEVRLAVAGQQLKFNARATQPLALGTRIFVIEVPTPTSVLVEPTPSVQ